VRVNIYLLPYTAARHLAMALWCAGAGLLAWWLVLTVMVELETSLWSAALDGPVLLCALAAAITGASVAGEDNLRRAPLKVRALRLGIGLGLGVGLCAAGVAAWTFGLPLLLNADSAAYANAVDPTLVSLSYRVGLFGVMGLSCGVATLVVRKLADPISHVFGGIAAGLFGGALWFILSGTTLGGLLSPYLLNVPSLGQDLFLAGAGLAAGAGFAFGLLTWGIPDDLYAGWLRVLSPERFGRRIPIDPLDDAGRERFVGHFPRGLDLWLPVQDGVMELHLSIKVDKDKVYAARGLSLQPTTVHRFLERVDLRYNPSRPAPFETVLSSGDRIVMGSGAARSEVEFLMLPKEER
jgi:hypothetical protein